MNTHIIQLFEWIKSQPVRTKSTLDDFLAMSSARDPFSSPQPARQARAAWFGRLWNQFARVGMHLRELHYKLVSQPTPILMPDGTPYENTDSCDKTLGDASLDARYLGVVDPTEVLDRRSAPALIFAPPGRDRQVPSAEVRTFNYPISLPSVDEWRPDTELGLADVPPLSVPSLGLLRPQVEMQGYDYTDADRAARTRARITSLFLRRTASRAA